MSNRHLVAGLLAILGIAVASARAQSTFVWSTAGGGTWSSSITSGTDNTADFSTKDITADATVTLDGDQTIGSMIFADTATTTAGSWIISSGSPGTSKLTLDVTVPDTTLIEQRVTPVINVGSLNSAKYVFITAPIAGNDGMTKAGAGGLVLSGANTYTGGTRLLQGTLYADDLTTGNAATTINANTSLGATGSTITLSAGELRFRGAGSDTTTVQNIFWDYNLVMDGMAPVIISADSRPGTGTWAAAANKNERFRSLAVNGSQQITLGVSSGLNGARLQIGDALGSSNTALTLNSNAYLSVLYDSHIIGKITDGGEGNTLVKSGSGNTAIIGAGNDYSGGTVVHQGGMWLGRITNLAAGETATYANARAGTGSIAVNPGAYLHVYSATNLAADQNVDVYSNRSGLGAMQIEYNAIPSQLRAMNSGVLGIGINSTTFNQVIDLGRLGDGTWSLGNTTTPGNSSGVYNATTLVTGANNTIRLGGLGGTLQIQSAVLGGIGTNLEIGRALYAASVPSSGSGVVTLATSTPHTFTGATTINRSSELRLASRLDTSGIDVFGTLNVQGSQGRLYKSSDVTAVVPVSAYGGIIRFDNTSANSDRWGDTTPVTLWGSGFELINSNVAGFTETIGAIDFSGYSGIKVARAGNTATLNAGDLTRQDRGTLSLGASAAARLGSSDLFKVANGSIYDAVAGGSQTVGGKIVTPYIISTSDNAFVNYTANGFAPVVFDSTVSAGSFGAVTSDGSQLVDVSTASAALSADLDVLGLRTSQQITGSSNKINIRSGGLIVTAATTLGSNVQFATALSGGSAVEGLLYNGGTYDVGTYNTTSAAGAVSTSTGQLIAGGGLTKFGASTLRINSAQAGILGGVYVNQGTLELRNSSSDTTGVWLGTAANPDVITLAGGQVSSITLNLRTGVANQDWKNSVVLAKNTPIATINVDQIGGSNNGWTQMLGNLTLSGSAGAQGQQLNVSGANSAKLQFSGNAVFNGNTTLNVNSSSTDVYMTGSVTGAALPGGSAPIISKTGQSILRWDYSNSGASATFDAGTTFQMQGGTWEVRSAKGFGNIDSTVYLDSGNLTIKDNGAGNSGQIIFGKTTGHDLIVRGDSTLTVDRVSANTGNSLVLNNLTIGNQWLTVGTANSYRTRFNGTAQLNARSGISGGTVDSYGMVQGGSLLVGSGLVNLYGANNTFDGGVTVYGGVLRGMDTGSLGTGNIFVNAGSSVSLGKSTTLGAGQNIKIVSSAGALSEVAMSSDFALPTAAIDVSNASVGILGIGNGTGGTYATAIDMSTLGGGAYANWYLGSIGSGVDGRYTGATLGAGAGNVYRLGGGGAQLVLNKNAAITSTGAQTALGNNLLTGANSVAIGTEAGNMITNGYAYGVSIAGVNDFTLSTTVNRNSTLYLASEVAGGKSGLSTGDVDVYGLLALRNKGSLVNGTSGNTNAVTLHPGAILQFDNQNSAPGFSSTAVYDRWDNNTDVTLNGARLWLVGKDNTVTAETIGAITANRGSQIYAQKTNGGTNTAGTAVINTAGISRGANNGTLTVLHTTGRLGATTNNFERIIYGTDPTPINGMLAPWMVDGTDNTFLTYSTTVDASLKRGLIPVTYDKNETNFQSAALTGVEKVDVGGSANVTLTTNPNAYALRLQRGLTASGSFNTVTVRSGGLILGTNDFTSTANFKFANSSDALIEGLIFVGSGRTQTISGSLSGNGLTKFGDGTLILNTDQSAYGNGWVVNAGSLRADHFNALGSTAAGNTITLNGGNLSGINSNGVAFQATLDLNASMGTPDNGAYSMGTVKVYDSGRINARFGNQSDRTQTMRDIQVDSSGGSAALWFDLSQNDVQRVLFNTGNVTLNADTYVKATARGSGRWNAVSLGGLSASGKTLTKLDTGTLILPDIASTFTGGKIVVGTGPLRVTSNGSLGSDTTAVSFEPNSVLDIAVGNFSPASASRIAQQPYSFERWSVPNARPADFQMAGGVVLQLNTSVLDTRTVTFNPVSSTNRYGGGIEAFQYSDDQPVAINRTAGPNVSFSLNNADITLGYGSYNLVGGVQGKSPASPDVINPSTGALQGASLIVQGAIKGTGNLTKIGRDTVTLSGASTFAGDLQVDEGILRIGRDEALPSTARLQTRFQGEFDLSGYNQTFANIGTTGTESLAGIALGRAGSITNSAYDFKNLNVGNNDGNTYSYRGLITGNVNLVKKGTNTLEVLANNTYTGTSNAESGVLRIGADNALSLRTTIVMGSQTTAGTLDVANNQTATGLNLVTESTALTNNINIASGKTLTLTGNVLLGTANTTANTTSKLNITGNALVVNNGNGTFQVGGSTSASEFGSSAIVDLSGLSSLTATVGTFRVGDVANSSGNGTGNSDLKLATSNTITATTLQVLSGRFATNNTEYLRLGSGTNIINADTIQVGLGNGSDRSNGYLVYASTTGSLTLRARDGSSAANMQIVSGTSTSGSAPSGEVNLTGHNADIKLNSLEIASRTTGSGSVTGAFKFDTGILGINNVKLGARTGGAGTPTHNATLEIGGGAASVGGITMAEVNLTGSTVNAIANFKGGTTTMGGDIVRGAVTAGSATATLNVDGGVLNMNGNAIGSLGNAITANLKKGTISNLKELNGGGDFTKISDGSADGGVLVLDGANSFTSAVKVNAGTLLVNGAHSGTGGYTVNSGGVLGGTNNAGTTSIASLVTIATGGRLAPGAAIGNSIAQMTIGGLQMTGAAPEIAMDLNSNTTPGTTYDQLVVTNPASQTLAGVLRINLGASYVAPATGYDEFLLIANAGDDASTRGATYGFNSLILNDGSAVPLVDNAATINGTSYTLNYTANGGNDVALQIGQNVPEPSAIGLLALSAVALLGRRKRR